MRSRLMIVALALALGDGAAAFAPVTALPSPLRASAGVCGPALRIAREGGSAPLPERGSAPSSLDRRGAAAALGAGILSLLAPLPALADSTGKFTSKRTAKNRYVPRIKKGLAFIKAGDAEGFKSVQDDMITAMKLYGQAQKKGEVPDKISDRLDKDTAAFAEAAKTGDLAKVKEAFLVYFKDLPTDGKEPFGSGDAPPAPVPVAQ